MTLRLDPRRALYWLTGVLAILPLQGCVVFAAPPPLLTLGGPATTPRHHDEVGLGLGGAADFFSEANSGAQGGFAHFRRGLSDRVDAGGDIAIMHYGDKGTVTVKAASRFQLSPAWRFELGVGGAGDSNGGSVTGELGLTTGTRRDAAWNYYGSLRAALAGGIARDSADAKATPPPDALFLGLALGAAGRAGPTQRFILESGFGMVAPHGHKAGAALYVAAAILFDIAP
jgi:hypothetical protein